MLKLFISSLLLSNVLFGSATCLGVSDPDCPTVTFAINGTDYSDVFTVSATSPGVSYTVSANTVVDGVTVDVTATTDPDPVIGFGMSFSSGDPVIFLQIVSPYFSSTGLSQFGDGLTAQLSQGATLAGCLPPSSSAEAGVCPASPLGGFVEELSINGGAQIAQNPGSTSSFSGSFPSTGNVTLDLGFDLSGSVVLNGSAGFSAPSPEPGTIVMIGFGLVALTSAARRRWRAPDQK